MKVSLSGVVVDKVVTNPPYIVVREPWSSEIRLIVLLDAPMALQRWQTVSVTGFMSTLVTRERALSAAAVSVYTDASGTTALAPLPILPGDPVFPLVNAPLDLSVRSQQSGMETRGLLDPPSSDPPPDGPEYVCATVAEALARDVGDTVQLTAKPVISTGDDAAYGGYAVIGEDEGSEVIRAFTAADLTGASRAAVITGTIALDGNAAKVISVDGGPGYNPQSFVGTAALCVAGSICNAKLSPDAASVGLSSKIVSLLLPEEEALYVHEPGMALGLRVEMSNMPGGLAAGDFVNTLGVMATTPAGERYLAASEMDKQAPGVAPRPLVMTNRTVGGGNWHLTDTAGQAGAAGGQGLNTVGLLTRTTGRVTGVSNDESVIEIDDGSCGAAVCPLWVKLPGVLDIQPGDFVIVTGASSLTGSSSAPERLIRVATADDIQSGCWDDTDDPTVTITAPAADGITAETFEAISGAASDTARVVKVQVQVNGGSWTDATYTPSTHSWTRPWTPARGDYTISVRAYDCNGHVATASRTGSLVDVLSTARPEAEPVSDFLFGTVVPWNATLNGMASGQAGAAGLLRKDGSSFFWDPYARQQIISLRPGSIRFGDIPANWYRWRWGVGPLADRAPQPIGGRSQPAFSRSDYGIAEHIELCEAAGALPVVVLPFFKADGTHGAPVEAANFIKFCTEEAGFDGDWAVTTLNRHFNGNSPPLYSATVTYNVEDPARVVVSAAEPDVTLVFKCKTAMQAGQHPVDSAPGTGSHWQDYWTYWVTEDKPTGKLSWTSDQSGAPAGYWGFVREQLSEREEPFPIAHWELGNQLFAMPPGADEEDMVTAEEVLDTIVAIKAEFGAVKPSIGVPVSTEREEQGPEGYEPGELLDPDNYTAPPGEGWPFGFVVPHLYFGPWHASYATAQDEYDVLFDDAGTPPELPPLGATKVARRERDRLQGFAGALPLPPLWVSELNTRYGLYHHAANTDEELWLSTAFPHNHRLKSALGAAIVQLELAAMDALGSNLFLAANVQDGNAWNGQALRMIVSDKIGKLASAPELPVERGWVTPHYYAQKLLNAYAVGTADETVCSNPVLYAQGFRSEWARTLFVVNKDAEEEQTVRIPLWPGYQYMSQVAVITLSGTNGLESNNECTADGRADAVGWPAVSFIEFGGEITTVTVPPASMTVFLVEVQWPSFEIAGQVRDTVGRPLAGVTVEATNGTAFTAVTDDYGIYRLSFLPADAYTVSVTGVGDHVGSSQQVDLEQEPFPIANFTLTPRLSGTVKRPPVFPETQPQPVPGAAVWVEPSGGGAVLASTTTDCEGNFVLPVAAGTYRLDAAHTSFGNPDYAAVDVTRSAACYTIVLADFADPTACE